MIIKLAQFESEVSELEKEASFLGGNAKKQVRAIMDKVMKGGVVTHAEAALLDAHVGGEGLKNWGRGRVAAAGRGLDTIGSRVGKGIDDVTGLNISGKAGGRLDSVMEHLSRNKAKYAGGAAVAGGAGLAYKNRK